MLEARSVRLSEKSSIHAPGGSVGNYPLAIRITASERVLLDGESIIDTDGTERPPSPIAIEDRGGPKGSLHVELRNGSKIQVSYRDAGGVSSDPISIRARSLRLDGSILTTGLDADDPLGIAVEVKQVVLSNGAEISTRSTHFGNQIGGPIQISPGDLVALIDSKLDAASATPATATETWGGGAISIAGTPFVFLDGSTIEASGVQAAEASLGRTDARSRALALWRGNVVDVLEGLFEHGTSLWHGRWRRQGVAASLQPSGSSESA